MDAWFQLEFQLGQPYPITMNSSTHDDDDDEIADDYVWQSLGPHLLVVLVDVTARCFSSTYQISSLEHRQSSLGQNRHVRRMVNGFDRPSRVGRYSSAGLCSIRLMMSIRLPFLKWNFKCMPILYNSILLVRQKCIGFYL